MNIFLEDFIRKKFKKPGKALDLRAGKFYDIVYLKQLGWKVEGVDLKTGVDLNKLYLSRKRPFDLVFSNYVIHKIKVNKRVQFIKNAYNNLKKKGWLFIHTFDKTDKASPTDITGEYLKEILMNQGFKNIKINKIKFYDNDFGHKHWHKILEVTAKKV